MSKPTITDLVGQTILAIRKTADTLEFDTDGPTGRTYRFYHADDCCESVLIEDVIGDRDDLIGNPLLVAEEVVHRGANPPGVPAKQYQDSFTWTFYRFQTIKGAVTVRWYGESNGYYSESVDFMEVTR